MVARFYPKLQLRKKKRAKLDICHNVGGILSWIHSENKGKGSGEGILP
jgi:hypothetical protein